MRFHTVAALYVLSFARFFDFSREDYVLLLLTISGVIALEAINTAIEELCDKVCREHDIRIKRSKDAAAGAVMIMSLFAAVIGVVLFWDIESFQRIWHYFITRPPELCGLIILTVFSVIYIIGSGKGKKKKRNMADVQDKLNNPADQGTEKR